MQSFVRRVPVNQFCDINKYIWQGILFWYSFLNFFFLNKVCKVSQWGYFDECSCLISRFLREVECFQKVESL